jgi:hypothetical protein
VRKSNLQTFSYLLFVLFAVVLLVPGLSGAGGIAVETVTQYKAVLNVDSSLLEKHVAALAAILPPRNYGNIPSLERAAAYIEHELKPLNCRLSRQPFAVEGKEYHNIICSFGPEEGERIVVGAHYDVAGDQPGADDNASGVAGALEVSRLLNALGATLKRRVDVVFYSLEEPPFFGSKSMGSYAHARFLSQGRVPVKLMICLESIGYFLDLPGSQGFPVFFFGWFFPDRGNFVVVVGKWGQGDVVKRVQALMAQVSTIMVERIVAPKILPGIGLSDHLNYWKFGYPAVMVTDSAFYRNTNYHRPSDTPETLNFQAMAEVVKGVVQVVLRYGETEPP